MPTESKKLYETAMRLLARREHSRQELQRKLIARDFDEAAIATLLDQLIVEGYQSDQRYTEAYVRMRAAAGFGPLRIRLELNERGVSADLIDEHLDLGEQIWLDNALQVRQKKFGGEMPEDYVAKMKQLKFLQYRGFNTDKL